MPLSPTHQITSPTKEGHGQKTDPEEIMSSTTQRSGLTEQGVKGYNGNAMQKFILHLPGAPQPSF